MPSAQSGGEARAFAHCPLRRTMFNVATFLRVIPKSGHWFSEKITRQ
jgi:hypothetical protein